MQLKGYQQRTLDTLKSYFQECVRLGDADIAYYQVTRNIYGRGIQYNSIKELPGLPYICLRIPTGGGKTLVATHAVGIAADHLLQTKTPLILWLVPSNAIKDQTVKALKNRQHPYRQALNNSFENVEVLEIGEALSVQSYTLAGGATVIVSTMQAFRVDDTEGRKVYEASGSLMGHFFDLTNNQLARIEHFKNGSPITSLANVLRLHRPIVVVDEAHNARTLLSFETLSRFDPSCILEFTATPDQENNPSNVLYSVSAAELKTEDMIKLPIRLETHMDWRTVIGDAVALRNGLEVLAGEEEALTGEYIRPIMLLQAQPKHRDKETLTVDHIKKILLEDHRIPDNQVKLATGEDNQIEGLDLLDSACPVRYIITVQALREGWDCPFAYVLCSLAESRSSTAVEQILGRVLRLPKAKRKSLDKLNMAYAFAASQNFITTANALSEALVQNGFERQEVSDLIIRAKGPAQQELDLGPLFNRHLNESLQADEAQEAKLKNFQEAKFRVPILCFKQGDLLEPFEETHILEMGWSLAKRDPSLSEVEFASDPAEGQQLEIDVSKGKVQTRFLAELQTELQLLDADKGWDVTHLVRWLDRNIEHRDLGFDQTVPFLTRMVQTLIRDRGLSLDLLVKDKYRLMRAAEAKINQYRISAKKEIFDQLLFNAWDRVTVTPEKAFTYDPDPMHYPYPATGSLFQGQHTFKKHFYPTVGGLTPKSEEYRCAQWLDAWPEVEVWVRNLDRRADRSFWLQTSTDKFYPDFVCKLRDGRYLVVEYKGEHLWSNEDSEEKRIIGGVWEKYSEGKCLFVMPKGMQMEEIRAKVKG